MKGRKTGGRLKGTPNQTTTALKEAILSALDAVGGQAYLVNVANEDPRTFCTLLGKVLPMQVTGDSSNPVVHEVRQVIVDPHG
jgi:hypothetical protein